ncbi:MAG: delta-60 repeat domain-containing protein [Chloroflexaceae bacterium]|nr:delta-60 repeat domain-containing protein [Chloroflexaceae bacterium]
MMYQLCLRFCLASLVSLVCFAVLLLAPSPWAMAGPFPNQPPAPSPTLPPAPAGAIAFSTAMTVTSEMSGSLRLGLQRLNGQEGPVYAQVQAVGGTATADDYRFPAGSLDPQFLSGLSGGNQRVSAVVRQPDGKILVGGDFTSMNGTARNRIARLNADGTLDSSFNPGAGADRVVEAIALQSDGKLLIGGEFTQVAGVNRSRIARLNADGTLDSSFNPGGLDGPVWELIVQPDGKRLIHQRAVLVSCPH